MTTPPVRPAARADVMTGAATELDAPLPAAPADSAWLPATRVIEPRASRLRADRLGSALISPLNGGSPHGKELTDCAPGPQEFAAAIGLAGNLAARFGRGSRRSLMPSRSRTCGWTARTVITWLLWARQRTPTHRRPPRHLAAAVAAGSAAPFTGLRCKNLESATRGRPFAPLTSSWPSCWPWPDACRVRPDAAESNLLLPAYPAGCSPRSTPTGRSQASPETRSPVCLGRCKGSGQRRPGIGTVNKRSRRFTSPSGSLAVITSTPVPPVRT